MSTILKTTDICKRFKGQDAVNHVSLNIERNKIYGLLGPNGAWKSTILKIISEILKPTSGKIEMNGQEWCRSDLKKIGALIETPPLSALAHDLKTPLTIIRGNVELLCDTSLSDEQRECVCYVKSSVEQMQNYVLSLIDIAKAKQDFLVHKQGVVISKFLAELKMQAKGLCSVKNIQLKWNENYQIEQAVFDSGQMIRAIMNVISNAVEHTPEGGCISFTVYEDEKSLIILVCDSGNGF